MKNAQKITKQVRSLEDNCRYAAYVILKDSDHVGTVRIKYPPKGHGEQLLTAYVADWTLNKPEHLDFTDFTRWQIGKASGYGYDKASAALSGLTVLDFTFKDSGSDWTNQVKAAGFTLLQAI